MPPKKTRSFRTGFTLIELLVVISVIAVLIAMLLPSLSRASDAAKRVACASNQQGIGRSAHLFAMDRREFFPRAYLHMNGNPWPSFIELVYGSHPSMINPPGLTVSPTSEAYWKAFGTDLRTWQEYGVQRIALPALGTPPSSTPVPNSRLSIFRCPAVKGEMAVANSTASYGEFLAMYYMYLGGYPAGPLTGPGNPNTVSEPNSMGISNNAAVNCPNRKPAVKTSDAGLEQRLLSLDRVYADSAGAAPITNHGYEGTPASFKPTFVNALWGDGHVSSAVTTLYDTPCTSANWSMRQTTVGPFFYWGGR